MEDIAKKFRERAEETAKLSSLRNKLKAYVEEAKGIVIDSILTLDKLPKFEDLLKQGELKVILYRDSILTVSGIRHTIDLRFEAGRCDVISELFPRPFIVSNHSNEMVAKVFFNIVNAVRKLDGVHITKQIIQSRLYGRN